MPHHGDIYKVLSQNILHMQVWILSPGLNKIMHVFFTFPQKLSSEQLYTETSYEEVLFCITSINNNLLFPDPALLHYIYNICFWSKYNIPINQFTFNYCYIHKLHCTERSLSLPLRLKILAATRWICNWCTLPFALDYTGASCLLDEGSSFVLYKMMANWESINTCIFCSIWKCI